ncbi:TrkA C-terminal domain-containing protein [Sulfurimonas sp. CS5]|uniref:TrkA C-terminal domain-containing protein n=1 Tax=Sulfurimonas sp. CS5 TaxID=3391145 RepID=UPI0039E9C61B
MFESNALIFGLNDFTSEIEKNIASNYKNIHILELAKDGENGFDLSDNWDHLKEKVDINDSVAFCVLEDMAENIFLTISLRDTFKDLIIVALAQDKESSDKLKLAGATRILPTTQTTANVIVEMLEKPIVTEVLHEILYEKSSLKIAQIKIGKNSSFEGRHPADVEWDTVHGIIVISVVHEDMSREFIYSSKSKHHLIKSGDIFVVVGYENDIKEFEKLIGEDE